MEFEGVGAAWIAVGATHNPTRQIIFRNLVTIMSTVYTRETVVVEMKPTWGSPENSGLLACFSGIPDELGSEPSSELDLRQIADALIDRACSTIESRVHHTFW
jgi:hypothetical protein